MNTFLARRARPAVVLTAIVIGMATALIASVAAAVPAAADPNPPPGYAAVGSRTLQDLFNAFGNGYIRCGAFHTASASIASYDAFGPGYDPANPGDDLIRTRAFGAYFGRPHGTLDGVKALSASWNTANHAFTNVEGTFALSGNVDIARAALRPDIVQTWANARVAYVPLARDAVSVAIYGTAVTNLSTDQLAAIYGANNGIYHQNANPSVFTVGDLARNTASPTNDPVYVLSVTGAGAVAAVASLFPELPYWSADTRLFFLGAIGVGGTSQPAIGAWVDQSGAAENTASVLTSNGQLIPFSAAQWIAQKNCPESSTFIPPATDPVKLLNVNGLVPYTTVSGKLAPADSTTSPVAGLYGNVANPAPTGVGSFARDTYSVVDKSAVDNGGVPGNATDLAALVMTGLPGRTTVLNDFGFLPVPYSANSADWLYSLYTNP